MRGKGTRKVLPLLGCSPTKRPNLPCRLTHGHSHQHQGPGRVAMNRVGSHLRVQRQPVGDGGQWSASRRLRPHSPAVHAHPPIHTPTPCQTLEVPLRFRSCPRGLSISAFHPSPSPQCLPNLYSPHPSSAPTPVSRLCTRETQMFRHFQRSWAVDAGVGSSCSAQCNPRKAAKEAPVTRSPQGAMAG